MFDIWNTTGRENNLTSNCLSSEALCIDHSYVYFYDSATSLTFET